MRSKPIACVFRDPLQDQISKIISVEIVDGGKTAEAKHQDPAFDPPIQKILQVLHEAIMIPQAGYGVKIVFMLGDRSAEIYGFPGLGIGNH